MKKKTYYEYKTIEDGKLTEIFIFDEMYDRLTIRGKPIYSIYNTYGFTSLYPKNKCKELEEHEVIKYKLLGYIK